MSENQYDAPAMEVIELDKEDAICTSDICFFDGCSDTCSTPGANIDQSDDSGTA